MTTASKVQGNVPAVNVYKPGLLQNRKFIDVALKVLLYIVLTIGLLALLMPSFWMVSTSFKELGTEFAKPIEWLPREVVWTNYTTLPEYFDVLQYTVNTLILVVGNLVGTLLTASMVAYAFGRLRWPGRNFIFGICLATMMLPGVVTMIPTFIIFKQLGWLNTFIPLIIGSYFGGGAFNIFLIRQFFMTLPMELDEAARIDGATGFTIWSRIVIPLSKPVLATVAIFTFLGHWNDFMGPLIYLNDESLYPLSIGLNIMYNTYTGYGNAIPLIGPVMAASVLMTLPVILIFFVGQKYFVRGISTTGMAAR
jgi:multiple sugar transport system permease protein